LNPDRLLSKNKFEMMKEILMKVREVEWHVFMRYRTIVQSRCRTGHCGQHCDHWPLSCGDFNARMRSRSVHVLSFKDFVSRFHVFIYKLSLSFIRGDCAIDIYIYIYIYIYISISIYIYIYIYIYMRDMET